MAHLNLPALSDIEAEIRAADSLFAADIDALNTSGVSGTAVFAIIGDTLQTYVFAEGLVPDQVHIQHIHGPFDAVGRPADARTPTIADDTDRDGLVEVAEGLASYGDILLPLEDQSDGFNNGPFVEGTTLRFAESFDLGDDSQFLNPLSGTQYTADDLMPLQLREIVIHGVELTDGQGAGTMGEADGTPGYKLALPAAAGEIEAVDTEEALDILDGILADTFVLGTDASEELRGGDGDDIFDGGDGDDRLVGGTGEDWLVSGAGDDLLYGQTGGDTLTAGDGDDRLVAGEGADLVFGGAGRDVMFGQEGDDRLDGGAGASDLLIGGAGADTFVLSLGSEGERVMDFTSEDRIDVSGTGATAFEDLVVAEVSGSTVLRVGEDRMVLLGTEADGIGAEDFIFA